MDAEAAVPVGASSNYFTDRDDLLGQVDAHLYRRLAPDPAGLPGGDETVTVLQRIVATIVPKG